MSPEEVQERACDIIKVKMRRNPVSSGSETYNFKMKFFENGSPEELLKFPINVNNSIEGTGTITVGVIINLLCTLLRRKSLREFDNLASQNNGTTNSYLMKTQEGLLDYLFPINSLSKQKRAIRCYMNKPHTLSINILTAFLTELNNYLPLFPGSNASKNMKGEELDRILLHTTPNSWAKHAYLQ